MSLFKSKTTTNERNESEILSWRDQTMVSLLFRLSVPLAAMGVLAGCGGEHVYHRSLSPNQTAQDCWSYSARQGTCTGLEKWGGSCSSVDGTLIQKNTVQDLALKRPTVGFTHKFYPGTQPLPCTEVYMWKSRAYVNFDLSVVEPKIQSQKLAIATLSWGNSTKHYEEGWVQPNNVPPHCFLQLFEATGPWKSLDTPGNLITELDQWWGAYQQTITITPVVKKLLAAGGGQLRLFFTGSDEGNYGQENKSCETTLDSLKLDLTYAAK